MGIDSCKRADCDQSVFQVCFDQRGMAGMETVSSGCQDDFDDGWRSLSQEVRAAMTDAVQTPCNVSRVPRRRGPSGKLRMTRHRKGRASAGLFCVPVVLLLLSASPARRAAPDPRWRRPQLRPQPYERGCARYRSVALPPSRAHGLVRADASLRAGRRKSAQSDPGAGSVFRIALPATDPKHGARQRRRTVQWSER